MKTSKKNKVKLLLMTLCLVALTVTISCTKDAQECITTGSNSSGRDCENVIEEDPIFIPLVKTEDTKVENSTVTDSTAAVAKLPVRGEVNE